MSSAPTDTHKTFLADLARLVGPSHLLTDPAKTQRYRKGFRSGQGEALAVVFPGTLLELWRVLNACVDADKIILMQAANTGLTEGSTPNGNDYDREIVIISTLRLDKLHLLDKGEQVLAWPGTTLYSLEKALKPLGREPHSVIGSSCIGASVIGGICNNSGGSLVQRGPAYTEMSLFAQIDADGKLKLVNHLGIDLGSTPEQILSRLDDERISDSDVLHDGRHAHDHDYVTRVRDVDADTPARYNADPDRLFESSAPASWRFSPCVSILSRRKSSSRCFTLAPTSRRY
jgi:D-lactate dehydrogenase